MGDGRWAMGDGRWQAERRDTVTTSQTRVILRERSERKDRFHYRDPDRVTAVNCLAERAILSAASLALRSPQDDAALAPVRRATRVDPVVTLRAD